MEPVHECIPITLSLFFVDDAIFVIEMDEVLLPGYNFSGNADALMRSLISNLIFVAASITRSA